MVLSQQAIRGVSQFPCWHPTFWALSSCFWTRPGLYSTHSAWGVWDPLSPNNCRGSVAISIMFSFSQCRMWVLLPAIFLSYQPYNSVVIIHSGMSLELHLSLCLCFADCLLICQISGFRFFSKMMLVNCGDIHTKRKRFKSSLFDLFVIGVYIEAVCCSI